MGSWIFGYADALARVGVRSVFVFVTRQTTTPERTQHAPTGAAIWRLPVPRVYSLVRGGLDGGFASSSGAAPVTRDLAPYLATPLVALARVLRSERCGAVICQEYECPRFDVAVLLGRMLGIPVFPSFHGGDRRSRLERLLHPVTVRACAGVIISAAAEASRVQRLYGVPDSKLARIPNPIDLDVWRPEDRSRARAILGVSQSSIVAAWHGGVYLEAKGLDLLVEAWDRVTSERPDDDLQLFLLGGGADGHRLKQLIEARGVPGVRFLDRWIHDRDQLRSHLSAADFYVFPSRNEGFPNALLEAMACGLPVIATDIAGVPDIVGCGSRAGGVLIRPNDARALAEAIGEFVDDEPRRLELARRARLRVDERFSLDVVGRRLRDFLVARGVEFQET